MKNVCVAALLLALTACSSIPLQKISKDMEPKEIELSIIPGSYNVESFKTYSQVEVSSKGESEEPQEEKVEKATFKLHRKALDVDEKNRVQFRHWVGLVKGKVDLASMGFPPPGKATMSIVNPDATIEAVKGVPLDTVFYMPRIPLPEKKVKVGDSWKFEKEWKSLKTGWPFVLHLNVTLKDWYRCGGLECAHLTYTGYVEAPKKSPVSEGILKSKLEGEFIYAPIGHQFLWSISKSSEVFINKDKKVEVDTCTTSFQVQPDKESDNFISKYQKNCNS